MAGEGGLDGDFGRFEVADLADHDDVGVLAQEGAQHLRERVSDLVVDRHLHDAVHVVFDRFLGGEQLRIDRVDAAQHGVERRRLAGARRAGHDDDAVRLLDVHRDLLVDVFRKAHVLKVERRGALVEDTHHDGFAVGRRQTAHAQVDGVAGHGDRDAAVLRDAALGDVEVRHDLDARDDGGGHRDVRRLHLVEGAVHAVADLEVVFEGLDVDVGRAVHDALVEDHVDELDDGVVVRRAFEGGHVVRVALEALVALHALAEALEHVRHGIARIAVVLGDALVDVLFARHDEAHLLREGEGDLVGDARVHEAGRRERDAVAVHAHAEDVVHARDGGGDGVDDVVVELHLREVHDLAALVGRHHAEERVLVEVAAVHDDFADGLAARVGLFLADRVDAVLVEDAVLDQEVEQRIKLLSHERRPISSLSFATTESGSCAFVTSSS